MSANADVIYGIAGGVLAGCVVLVVFGFLLAVGQRRVR